MLYLLLWISRYHIKCLRSIVIHLFNLYPDILATFLPALRCPNWVTSWTPHCSNWAFRRTPRSQCWVRGSAPTDTTASARCALWKKPLLHSPISMASKWGRTVWRSVAPRATLAHPLQLCHFKVSFLQPLFSRPFHTTKEINLFYNIFFIVSYGSLPINFVHIIITSTLTFSVSRSLKSIARRILQSSFVGFGFWHAGYGGSGRPQLHHRPAFQCDHGHQSARTHHGGADQGTLLAVWNCKLDCNCVIASLCIMWLRSTWRKVSI